MPIGLATPMSLTSLPALLGSLQQQPHWAHLRYYQHILLVWRQVVAPEIACNTRLLAVRQQVLWVATASPVWAQTLAFQRTTLLAQLNPQLSIPLQDLRFSPGQWYGNNHARETVTPVDTDLSAAIPPVIASTDAPELEPVRGSAPALDPWLAGIEQHPHTTPPCPQCQAPTDFQSLARWSVCACCACQQWTKILPQQREY